jgi:hypothetical protein
MTVHVARDAPGDLLAGVRARLDAVDCVASVEALDVRGVEPSLNDLRVAVRADLRLRGEGGDPASDVARLEAGFGVHEVSAN